MEYKRYIALKCTHAELGKNIEIQIFELDAAIIICIDNSSEMLMPKAGWTARNTVDAFVAALLEKGCELVIERIISSRVRFDDIIEKSGDSEI